MRWRDPITGEIRTDWGDPNADREKVAELERKHAEKLADIQMRRELAEIEGGK